MNQFFSMSLTGLFICLSVLQGGAHGTYTITGDLSPMQENFGDLPPDSLMLAFQTGYDRLDSLDFDGYRFHISGTAGEYTEQGYILVYGPAAPYSRLLAIPVFLEPGQISVESVPLPDENIFHIAVTGTPSNDLIDSISRRYLDLTYEMLAVAFQPGQENTSDADRIAEMLEEQTDLFRNMYRDHRDSPIAPCLCLQEFYDTNRYKDFEREMEHIRNRFPGHPDLNYMTSIFQSMPGIEVGQPFPAVSLASGSGQTVLTGNFSGNYLLIDFWSSVSGVNLEQFPLIREIPERYDGHDLIKIGISTDLSEDIWRETVKKEKIDQGFIQLWDSDRAVSRELHITTYPTRFLVDPNGIIVAKGNFTDLTFPQPEESETDRIFRQMEEILH